MISRNVGLHVGEDEPLKAGVRTSLQLLLFDWTAQRPPAASTVKSLPFAAGCFHGRRILHGGMTATESSDSGFQNGPLRGPSSEVACLQTVRQVPQIKRRHRFVILSWSVGKKAGHNYPWTERWRLTPELISRDPLLQSNTFVIVHTTWTRQAYKLLQKTEIRFFFCFVLCVRFNLISHDSTHRS